MNDELSNDKKKFILPLTTDLQNHKEKVFYNARVFLLSPKSKDLKNFIVQKLGHFLKA